MKILPEKLKCGLVKKKTYAVDVCCETVLQNCSGIVAVWIEPLGTEQFVASILQVTNWRQLKKMRT
jgi:hypothetical protein